MCNTANIFKYIVLFPDPVSLHEPQNGMCWNMTSLYDQLVNRLASSQCDIYSSYLWNNYRYKISCSYFVTSEFYTHVIGICR